MRRSALVLALLASLGAAEPPAPDPVRLAKATELVAAMGLEAALRERAEQDTASAIAGLEARLADQPEAVRAAVAQVAEEARGLVRTRIDWPAIAAGMAGNYAASLSAAELDAALAFHASAAGQRLIAGSREVERQASAASATRLSALQPELRQLVDQRIGDAMHAAAAAQRAQLGVAPDRPFPEIVGTSITGDAVSLAALAGKVVLVDFWATWCGPCVAELPAVSSAYADLHGRGFEIIGISLDEDLAKLGAFTTGRKMPWPQLCDGKGWSSALAKRFAITSIPATFLIGRDGKLVAANLRGAELRAAIEKALAAPAP